MKHMRKVLCILLALIMVIGLLPMAALAEGATTASDTELVKAFHLDCGRKYFSVEDIKAIIDTMYQNGYNTLELAVGNDGLRFLLDDMKLTVNGTTYASDAVKDAIHTGNTTYYDCGAKNELTQSEMDTIVAYAKARGITIMPLINTPGHMDAILSAANTLLNQTCNYSGSNRTIDITNATATAFTQALLQKYVDYFADKGCQYFNMGCDEYANDIYTSGGMGFGNLSTSGKYSYFVSYVNDIAAMVEAAGMTPMAFNDGIYYNQNTSGGTFNQNIVISYWSSGWSGYNVASASYLANMGHEILNTNGDWYDVYKYDDNKNLVETIDSALTNIENTPYNKVMGNSNTMDVVGCMICLWCDAPSHAYGETEANNVTRYLSAFAAKNSSIFTAADTDVEDSTVEYKDANDTKLLSVTAPALTELEVTAATITAVEGCDETLAYNVIPKTADGNYTGEAKVSFKVPDGWDTTKLTGFVVTDGAAEKISGTYADGYYTFTAPHFSDTGIGLLAAGDENVINLKVGESKSVTDNTGNYEATYTGADLNTNIATVTVDGTEAQTATRVETPVTSMTTGQAYFIKNADGKYLNGVATFVEGIQNATDWTWQNGYLKLGNQYLKFDGESWYTGTTSGRYLRFIDGVIYGTRTYEYKNGQYIYSYSDPLGSPVLLTETEGQDASTEITFTGVAPGTTSVTVGATTYTIKVAPIAKEENRVILVNETDNLTVPVPNGGTVSYEVTAGADYVTVSASGVVTAGAETGTATVVATTKTMDGTVYGTYTYFYSVETENQNVAPLQLEYWITNAPISEVEGSSEGSVLNQNETDNIALRYSAITAASAATENGIDLTEVAPETATHDGRTLYFWRCRLLDTTKANQSTSGTERQTTKGGDDETTSGVGITRIRRYHKTWQAYTTDNEWVTIADNHQLVAYYLEKVQVADEVISYAADWGKPGDGSRGNGEYLESDNSNAVAFQVVYEDGTTNPSTTTAADLRSKSLLYNYWTGGRGLGTIIFEDSENYEIYKVTAETGTKTSSSSGDTRWGTITVNSYSWNDDELTVWEGESEDSVVVHKGARTFAAEGEYNNLVWKNKDDAILLRVYVRAKVTEDSLTVRYVNEKTGQEFYSYNIAVKTGTSFEADIGLNTAKNVINGDVINILDKTQTVSSDLSTMPEISTAYRYSDYTCTKLVRNDDKTVTLYYNFNNEHSFVVDFGLPLELVPSDIGLGAAGIDWRSAKVTGAKYGTVTPSTDYSKAIYTLNKTLDGVEQLTLTAGESTQIVYIYPATSVYYEEGFATYTGNWNSTNKGTGAQTTSKVSADVQSSPAVYGYDAAYAEEMVGPSNGTQAASSTMGDKASFTFYGTGVDIMANTSTSSGQVFITVTNADTKAIVKSALVNTIMKSGNSDATSNQHTVGFGEMIASYDFGTRANYEVTVYHVMNGDTVALDGFRVRGVLDVGTTAYANDLEDNPQYIEVRDAVMAVAGKTATGDLQVNAAVGTATGTTISGAVIVRENNGYDPDYVEDPDSEDEVPYIVNNGTVEDYLANGPKNEIYLRPGQALAFKVETGRVMEIGMSALNVSTTCEINGSEKTIDSCTDMYYQIPITVDDGVIVTIKNTSVIGTLVITKIKICDDPSAGLAPMTEADLDAVFELLGLLVKGDADENGQLTLVDVYKAFNLAVENSAISKYLLKVLDMNGDGQLNIIDVSMIYNRYIRQ